MQPDNPPDLPTGSAALTPTPMGVTADEALNTIVEAVQIWNGGDLCNCECGHMSSEACRLRAPCLCVCCTLPTVELREAFRCLWGENPCRCVPDVECATMWA